MSQTNTNTGNEHTASKKSKAIASLVALSLLGTGTYAWQAFDQVATNEVLEIPGEPGGRLRDDFNYPDKNVYVENYADAELGAPVYARIRLDEYLEYGAGAGTTGDLRSDNMTVVRGDLEKDADGTPEFTDPTTWDTYLFGSKETIGEESIRTYRTLDMGGSTVYMPTFNKNTNDLTADINGTYEGEDGDREEGTKYDDYKSYTVDEEVTADATYAYTGADGQVEDYEGAGYYTQEETHVAKDTERGTVVSMEAWKAMGSPTGTYWVYDVDGWAYWAQGIDPQEATGLLLDGIKIASNPADEWYYAINVVSQIATAGDWGDSDAKTGMYEHGITENGLGVLNKASKVMTVSDMNITRGDGEPIELSDLDILATQVLDLDVVMDILNGVGDASEKDVTWSITQASGTTIAQATLDAALKDGTFTTTAAMAGSSFTITVTSGLDDSKSESITVYVYTTSSASITVAAQDDVTSADSGDRVKYTATVSGLMNQDVRWEVTGHTSDDTSIDANGNLILGQDEEGGGSITITAYSTTSDAIKGSTTISVIATLANAPDGYTGKVMVEGYEFYVIGSGTHNGREVRKILLANQFGTSNFGSNSVWSTSNVRTSVKTWIEADDRSGLYAKAVKPLPTTLSDGTATSSGDPALESDDVAFLLSQTEARALSATIRTTGSNYWLRSPYGSYAYYVVSSGNIFDYYVSYTYGVRPALWVYLD